MKTIMLVFKKRKMQQTTKKQTKRKRAFLVLGIALFLCIMMSGCVLEIDNDKMINTSAKTETTNTENITTTTTINDSDIEYDYVGRYLVHNYTVDKIGIDVDMGVVETYTVRYKHRSTKIQSITNEKRFYIVSGNIQDGWIVKDENGEEHSLKIYKDDDGGKHIRFIEHTYIYATVD